jgi:hypothetical protein
MGGSGAVACAVGAHGHAPLQTVIDEQTVVAGRTLRGRVAATLYGGQVLS